METGRLRSALVRRVRQQLGARRLGVAGADRAGTRTVRVRGRPLMRNLQPAFGRPYVLDALNHPREADSRRRPHQHHDDRELEADQQGVATAAALRPGAPGIVHTGTAANGRTTKNR